MRLSAAKINHLAHVVSDVIENDPNLDVLRDTNDIRLRVKMIITDELKLEDEIDHVVRQILKSMTKSPPEGSKEWDVIYERYYNEQLTRRRGHEKIRRIK
ncbi:DUF507 family protein [bacterium]|nr:DUF507 family protein [candidate division CSSED10-310 bacterium]